MIPSTTIVEVEGTIPGEKLGMGFDPGSIAHIIGVLTDLYSDPVMAVVREYSTNAWDSHVEAGVTDPIEIYTPTALAPCLRIVDHGVGLSLDDIRSIYSMYGASTKRGTDTQSGMLGLGSKSALTLTNQFTVDAVKNGKRTLVSVSRRVDGTGEMTVVSHQDTDRRNGVEITIPASGSSFLQTATKFFSYWPQERYLLNGGKVPSATESLEEVSPGVFVYIGLGNSRSSIRQSQIVMGGVAYPVNDNKHPAHVPYIAHVPIGTVDFTPNREALHYTEKTMKALQAITKRIDAGLEAHIQKIVDGCENAFQAYLYNKSITRQFPFIKLTYNGMEIPQRLRLDEITPEAHVTTMQISHRGSNSFFYHVNVGAKAIPAESNNVILIVGDGELESAKRSKVRKWMEFKQIPLNTLVLYSSIPADKISVFLEGVKTYRWEEIKTSVPKVPSVKLTRPITMFTRELSPSGKPWVMARKVSDTSSIDMSKEIVHFSRCDDVTDHLVHQIVKMFDCVIVQVYAGSVGKFSRDFKSTHVNDYMEKKMEEMGDPTENDLILLSISDQRNLWYTCYDSNRSNLPQILDPQIVRWIDAGNSELTPAAKAIKTFGLKFKIMQDPLKKYTLIGKRSSWVGWSPEEIFDSVIYMNAKYKLKDNND